MFHHVVGWLRSESWQTRTRGHWARVIGRNWARVSYGYQIEPTWLELNAHVLPIANLPTEFENFRIAQLSDFHCSRQVTPDYLEQAVDLAQAQHPDLIVLTGDFIHHGFKHIQPMAHTLGRLTAPHGVYAVLGNHDYSVRNALGFRRHRHLHRAVATALAEQGIRVLRNESVDLVRATSRIHLTGVEDLWSRVCDPHLALNGLADEVPRIVLAHNPRTIELLNGHRCDVMLSGHTHGGQVNWPGIGRPVLGKQARRFAAGLYRHNNCHLYVNKGVGFGFRFRFGVRPEVALVILQANL